MAMKSSEIYRRFVVVQVGVIAATLIAGTLAYIIQYLTGHDFLFGLIPFFDVGSEANFPTYVSTVNLLVAAGLCYCIYKVANLQGEHATRSWLLLSAIFVYLSIDEFAALHETLSRFRGLFPDSNLIPTRHSWLYAGVLLAGLLGLAMLPFLFRLPKRLALSFILAGCVFAFGVIGMEFAGSLMINHGFSTDGVAYQMRRLLEEGCEMYGIVIFNCAAANEIARRSAGFQVIVTDTGRSG